MDRRRRSLLATAASVVCSALAGCLGDDGHEGGTNQSNRTVVSPTRDIETAPTVEASFPQYQYDAGNTGAVPEVSGPTGAISSLFEFGTLGSERRLGSPSVADGTVYVTAAAGGNESTATAAGTGTTATADAGGETTVATADAGSETAETVVSAVDAATGAIRWETPYGVRGTPGPTAVGEDTVLAPVGGNVVALAAETGEQQWTYACGLASGITVAEEAVYVVGVEGGTATLYSLSVADGSVRWERTVDAETTYTTPAVADGSVYVGGTALQVFDTADGSEQWRVENPVRTAPAVGDDAVVAASSGGLAVYDTAGTEQWRVEFTEEDPLSVTHPPAVADGTVYLSVAEGIRVYDLDSGERSYAVDIGVDGTPVVADGYVYLFGREQLTCLAAEDGTTEWSYGTEQHADPGRVAPAVVDGVAYFPAERLYAIAE